MEFPLTEREFTPEMLHALRLMTDYCNADRFKKDLRKFFFEFLQYDGTKEAEYLSTLAMELDQLFDFLDVVEEFQQNRV